MKLLSQRNPKWSALIMKPSKLTVKNWGCTMVCCSMLSDYFKSFADPEDIIKTKKIQFTSQGLLLWSTIKGLGFKFTWRNYKRNDKDIVESLNDPKKAVILQVNSSHWVVALRKIGFLYLVADPWDSRKKLNLKKITGSSHFIATI